MGGEVFIFGAPVPPWSGTSPASPAGPCRPGLPPFAAVLVPVFSLSSPGALVCFVRCFFCFFLRLHRSPPVSPPGTSICPLSPPHILSPPPRCPRPLPRWVGEKGVGGGAPSLSVLWRKHVASTAQARGAALIPLQGGGGLPCGSRRHPSYPAFAPLVPPPRWGLHGACFLRAQSCVPSRTLSPLPPHLAALSSGEGGAVRPSLPSSPTLWGGGGVWGGGLVVFPSLHACRRHNASTAHARGAAPIPLQGGGGACLVAPVVALSTLRSQAPVVPPLELARRVPSTGTVVWSVPHPLTAASPPCRFVLGGGALFAPPLPASPTLGGAGVCGGGRGAHVVFPSLHTCRRHVSSTTQARGEALGCCGGGRGFSPLGLPALLHDIGSAPGDLQPLLPLGGSRHVSAWCSVCRASLLCPYLLEEVRTRVETDDEEVRAAGRTYRTPRRLLAPSAALDEGRAPVSAPNSPGGADCASSPWCPCMHFRAV